MAIRDTPLDIIDDNPYNPRKHYAPAKVKEMADSLREVGMRQGVEGRQVDGRVQLAYGHMRLRAYRHNLKQRLPGSWATMPVDVKELSDRDMFDFALEENLRRTEIKPIEVARCIQGFSGVFPEVTEKTIGEKHGMTEANVSNMLRVLRLPEKFLEKIDEGMITFTQGRELLTLEGIPDAEELMSSALAGINTTGNKSYSKPNTVEGLQQSIHSVINNKFPPLDEEQGSYRYKLLFDTRAAVCLKCDKCIITHPTKSQAAHYCTNEECWKKKTEEHKDKAAAAAKAKMEAEVLERAQKEVAQRVAEAKEEIKPAQGKPVILIGKDLLPYIEASYSGDTIAEKGSFVKNPFEYNGKLYINTGAEVNLARRGFECYQLVPREEYTGVTRTYIVPQGREHSEYYEYLRNDPNGFYHGMLVKWGKRECVLVGPEVTFVYQGDQAGISQEKPPAAPAEPQYSLKKKGNTWIAVDPAGLVIAIADEKERANAWAVNYFKPVVAILNPSPEVYKLNHTYRINAKPGANKHTIGNGAPVTDVRSENLPDALKALGLKPTDVTQVKVYKSSGKVGTDGGVSAGWSKCTESMEEKDETAELYKERDLGAEEETPMSDEEFVARANARPLSGKPPAVPAAVPEEAMKKAKAAAGTRAEVLDLDDICTGDRHCRQMKKGYVNLDEEKRNIDDIEECLERCTHGFHYAFDSEYPEEKEIHICSDPDCLAKKKGARTRKMNAEGLARKNAERVAIKQVIEQVGQTADLLKRDSQGIVSVAFKDTPVVAVSRAFLELIIYNQLHSKNIATYFFGPGGKEPVKWLWDKLSAGTPQGKRNAKDLWKLVKKLSDAELARVITTYMFFYLQDHGDTASYEIKTAEPLGFFGITVEDKSEAKEELLSKELRLEVGNAR